jgi:hypothetical protein
MSLRDEVLGQLQGLVEAGQRAVMSFTYPRDGYNKESSLAEHELRAFVASAHAAIARTAGRDSEFFRLLPAPPDRGYRLSLMEEDIAAVVGSLIALKDAVSAGHLARLEHRVRASVEDDFLDQAQALLDGDFHPAASMVLVGGVLEDRLRQLCAARGVSPPSAKLTVYVDELYRADAFDKPTMQRLKSVAARRNDAAHGGEAASRVERQDVLDDLGYVRRFLADSQA